MKFIRIFIVLLLGANVWAPGKAMSQENAVQEALNCLHEVTDETAIEKAQVCFEITGAACFSSDFSNGILQNHLEEAACHRENVSLVLDKMKAFAGETSDDVTELTKYLRKQTVDRSIAVTNVECAYLRALSAGAYKPWANELNDEETASLDMSEGLCLMSYLPVHYWRVVVLGLSK